MYCNVFICNCKCYVQVRLVKSLLNDNGAETETEVGTDTENDSGSEADSENDPNNTIKIVDPLKQSTSGFIYTF